ncbi:MAG TPA: hypothetical protein VIJ12_04705 [Candidatus Baltobacteraceae bacterium]
MAHLLALSDDVGVIQHAIEDVPHRATGYCTDDIARAFIVCTERLAIVPADRDAERLASTCLAFLCNAQLEDGRFHNFMDYDRRWLDEVGTQDSIGRAIWSLGFGMRFAARQSWRRVCGRHLERALASIPSLTHQRAKMYAILGLSRAVVSGDAAPAATDSLRALADDLRAANVEYRTDGWDWFDETMTYDNARLPEALLRAGTALDDGELVNAGLRTFAFYQSVAVRDGIYVPVGNQGWYRHGGERAIYAQQPLEATAQIDASLAALEATGDPAFRESANLGLRWFYGGNTLGMTLARAGGGCCDGLESYGANANMGAESTLALLAGAYALADRPMTLQLAR